MTQGSQRYYVPEQSPWPVVGSCGLGAMAVGAGYAFHGSGWGWLWLGLGVITMVYMLQGWWGHVIEESMQGLYSSQMDRSFRWGMFWFIVSEVMFFVALFGVLFYVRHFVIQWLSGDGMRGLAHRLWPDFVAHWPVLVNPDPSAYAGPRAVVSPLGLPAFNTVLLLSSSVTITWAHHALRAQRRLALSRWLVITIALGAAFVVCQAQEYHHAYTELGLTLGSGIYGSVFFFLTGFHGLHVTLGTVMLITMWARIARGHFTPKRHFAFEATAWYWHFVDAVWLVLFCFVYWL